MFPTSLLAVLAIAVPLAACGAGQSARPTPARHLYIRPSPVQPSGPRPAASPAATGPRSGRDDDEEPSATWPQVAAARRVASAFFHSYIAYLYGRARARQVKGADPALRRQLAQGHATITPAERAERPRLTRLAVASAGPPVSVIAIAFVDVDHRRPLRLTATLEPHRRSWLVAAVDG